MTERIRIKVQDVELLADLKDTETAQAVWDALPLQAKANTWGKEIYFRIPVDLALEKGCETVAAGDLGYWPDGCAFCIFFGPTPASRGDEIRPASAVSVFGRVTDDVRALEKVSEGATVTVEQVE